MSKFECKILEVYDLQKIWTLLILGAILHSLFQVESVTDYTRNRKKISFPSNQIKFVLRFYRQIKNQKQSDF